LDPSIDGAIKSYGTPKKVPALYRPPEGDLDEARGELFEAVDRWQGEAINHIGDVRKREIRMNEAGAKTAWERTLAILFNPVLIPPVHGIEAGTGIGKSHEMRKTLEVLIWALPPGHCIFIAVPNHNLSEEMTELIRSQGISAAVYRGLSAQDPDSPKNKMCRIAADAEALRRGGSKMSDLCNECPHAGVCGWQRQSKLEAQVWVGAHNLLFHPRPDAIPAIDYVIVDESPISVGLNGFSPTDRLSVSPSQLRHRAHKGGNLLGLARNKLADAIENGSINEPLIRENFDLQIGTDIRKIRRFVYAEIKKVSVCGGSSRQALQKAIEEANYNRRRLVEVEIWNALRNLDEDNPIPGLRIEASENIDSASEHHLRLRQRREIHSDFQKPTLILDATPNWEAYQTFWNINQTTKIEAALPHVNFLQITWSAARAKLLTETETSNNNCTRMLHYIESRSVNFRKVLVICQMGLEKKFRELLPENVQISHFNAVRGLDHWGDVDCLIMIGRTQPPPVVAEMQAEVIFDKVPVSLGDAYYSKKDVGLTVTDVEVSNGIQMEYHPDSKSEVMRWLICEAELIQAIGRARGVNRTEDNPLQIDIIGTVPLPFTIDEVMSLDEAKPDPLEIMAGRGVILNCDPSANGVSNVVAAMLPDLYKTSDAVRSARKRSLCQTPKYIYYLGERHSERKIPKNWSSDLLKLADSRYAVPVMVRRRLWRILRPGETPPANARGSILGGVTYVLEPLLPEEFRGNAGYILKK
jgi:putative DNA primase/helicase